MKNRTQAKHIKLMNLEQNFQLTILTRDPIACPGKFVLNLARTLPLSPCVLIILPQIARSLDLCFGFVGDDSFVFAL